MSNLDNVTKLKHINSLADQTARAINELLINGLSGVGTADVFTGATSVAGGASGLVPAPTAGDDEKFLRGDGTWALPQTVAGGASSDVIVAGSTVLSTVPATVDGGMWYEINKPYIITKMHYGSQDHEVNKSFLKSTYNDYCVSWLPFNDASNPLYDVYGKNWQSSNGTPSMVDFSPFCTGKSVYITTDNYLTLNSLPLGGQDFTIDGWFFVIGGGGYKRTFEIWRAANGNLPKVERQICENNGSQKWVGSSLIPINYEQWTHCAMVYSHSTRKYTTYINGVLLGYNLNESIFQSREPLDQVFIGESCYHNSGGRIDAYVSNFRIFDGIALWTEPFTPPTAADYVLTA